MLQTMRKLSILIVAVSIFVVAGYLVFMKEHEVAPPPGWPENIKLYRNQIWGGETRVVDESSGQFLFMYLPEYDNHVHPVKIEKIDDRHWQVLFEKPQK